MDLFSREERRELREYDDALAKMRRARGLPVSMDGSLSKRMWLKCSPIRVATLSARLNLKDVANKAGLCYRTVRNVVSGRHVPTPTTLRGMAKALDVEPALLWDQHLKWLALEPTLDAHGIRKAARQALKHTHPLTMWMRAKGVTHSQVEEVCGVSRRTIQSASVGATTPALDTLVKFSSSLGVDLGLLVAMIDHWAKRTTGVPTHEVLGVAAELELELESMISDHQKGRTQ